MDLVNGKRVTKTHVFKMSQTDVTHTNCEGLSLCIQEGNPFGRCCQYWKGDYNRILDLDEAIRNQGVASVCSDKRPLAKWMYGVKILSWELMSNSMNETRMIEKPGKWK